MFVLIVLFTLKHTLFLRNCYWLEMDIFMFVKIFSFSSHIDFLFFTIASTVLFQMTMTSCLEYSNSSIGLLVSNLASRTFLHGRLSYCSKMQIRLCYHFALKPSIGFPMMSGEDRCLQAHEALVGLLPARGSRVNAHSVPSHLLHFAFQPFSAPEKHYVFSFYRTFQRHVPSPGRLLSPLSSLKIIL